MSGASASKTGSRTTISPASTPQLHVKLCALRPTDGGFTNIELTPMEIGKVAHVGMGQWFYSITQRDSKIVYIQRSDCSMENSEIKYMTPEQVKAVQAEAARLLAE